MGLFYKSCRKVRISGCSAQSDEVETGKDYLVFDPNRILLSRAPRSGAASDSNTARFSKHFGIFVTTSFDQYSLICVSFQTELPHDARVLFVDALAELRPHHWSYVPKLAHLFDILSRPVKIKTRQFKIELATDEETRNAAPDSTLLVNAFDYSNDNDADSLST